VGAREELLRRLRVTSISGGGSPPAVATMVDDGGAEGRQLAQGEERRVFIDVAERREAVRVHVGTWGRGMGAEAVATCGGAPANGGARVRAPVSARRPCGTDLGAGVRHHP
jgi:hypothetical protein